MQGSQETKAVELPFGKTIYQSSTSQGISSDSASLVEIVLKEEGELPQRVLDLGSGNGIISLMLKHYRPEWEVCGIEILSSLVQLAESNSRLCEEDITFIEADIKDFTSPQPYDLIVSNPLICHVEKGGSAPYMKGQLPGMIFCVNF